jgi:lysyl-tRNA synthetase class 2
MTPSTPLVRSLAAKDEFNEVIKHRVEKSCMLLDAGLELYPNDFRKDTDIGDILAAYDAPEDVFEDERLKALGREFRLAGRVLSLRSFGKVAFLHLQDQTGRMQVFVQREALGQDAYSLFKKFDIGDILGVRGSLFRTKTGELTLDAGEVRLITKSMRPLPEKYHGLKDAEVRYRQRYVDLIVTPRAKEIFQARTLIVREFRRFLDDKGILEVETPMMHPIPGGAAARPFVTHHNDLNIDLYMRIST